MAVDLHLHSTASDGTETPERVVELAVDAGLTTIALTDHDNLNGIAAAARRAHELGIGFIAGTELSVQWESSGAVHMLVYHLEPGAGPLQDRLAWLQHSRATRNERIAQRLQELGLDITFEEVAAEAGGIVIGRPHFAAVLISKGYVPDMQTAFDRYLAAGRPGYLPRERLPAAEAIELAHASRAVPVVAHPHTLGISAEEYGHAFERLAELGLCGIESYYAEYEPDVRTHLADICDRLGLVATGGSDFHGRYKPGLEVGSGHGDLVVPDDVVDALESKRNAG